MKAVLRLLLIVSLVVIPTASALAQDGGDDDFFCGELNEADCALLLDSMTAFEGVYTFEMPAWMIDAQLRADDQALAFATNGSGAVILPQELIATLSDLPLSPDQPLAIEPLLALLDQIDAAFIERALNDAALDFAIEQARLQTPEDQIAGQLEVVFKDFGLYLNMAAPNGAEAWFGDQIEISPADWAMLDAGLAQMRAELDMMDFDALLEDMPDLQPYMDRAQALYERHMSLTRAADQTLHGQDMAVFVAGFDLIGLMTDPDTAALLTEILQDPILLAEAPELQELDPKQVQFVLMTASLLIQGTEISSEQWVGLDDGYIHKFTLSADALLDRGLFGGDADVEQITLVVDFAVEMDRFNDVGADAFPVPADYYPLEMVEDFLLGDASNIKGDLRVGSPVMGEVSGDMSTADVYSLMLRPGDAITLEVNADDSVYLSLYGPDGFMIDGYDTYFDNSIAYTAEADGMHLVMVEADWYTRYELAVYAQD